MLYGFKVYAVLGKPYIVVRIPAHRSRFPAGGSHIEEP